MVRTVPLTIAAYGPPMVEALAGPLRPYLRAGDEVDLVSGNRDRPLSVEDLNRWAARLAEALPPGVRFSAHTASLDKVAAIARGALPSIQAILLDYEPNWDPEFTWEFAPTLAHFDRFAALCRAGGRRAVAYPTGRPLREGPLQAYRWDFGELRRHVDEVYPQTQHWATVAPEAWAAVLTRLRREWQSHGFDPGQVVVQLTIGTRENGLRAGPALERFREAGLGPANRLYLWWAPDLVAEVGSFLQALETPA